MQKPLLLLGIDTCGPSGSVALGLLAGQRVEILGQIELAGRTYSTTLLAGISALLARHGFDLKDLVAIVAVQGPGSFTGVRVCLSAAKGLAEAADLPIVAISRLAVLASKGGTDAAALDAHRHEVFLRLGRQGSEAQEMLAGAAELAEIARPAGTIAVCEDGAATLLAEAWTDAELVRLEAPTAADALQFAATRVEAGEFADRALLDGHYLRRSDAEIFGDPAAKESRSA